MPTSWRRINVTEDPELSEALRAVAPYVRGAPAARVVRDLAVKGAEAVVREHEERDAAIARLVTLSTERQDTIDWDVLERVDELAWGE